MRYIQLGSSVGCSRVPQVHFVRKQTMCKSLYTYLTICFTFEKPRWLLHNTADCAETVFSHLNGRNPTSINRLNTSTGLSPYSRYISFPQTLLRIPFKVRVIYVQKLFAKNLLTAR